MLSSFRGPFFEPHDHHIKHGGKKETEAGHAEHAEEDSGAERLAHFGAGAFAENKRKDTENEGKRSHQDRTQAQATGFDRSGEAILAVAILDLFRKLDDQDGVLAGEPDQN